MSQSFQAKKQNIVAKLSVEDIDYTDASPKGSVDVQIRELVNEINSTNGFVTTSSCSGRVAVFVEGPSKAANHTERTTRDTSTTLPNSMVASAGGKGGGRWLFTSHDAVEFDHLQTEGDVFELFGFHKTSQATQESPPLYARYVHFKFEPMILHILTESPQHAQQALHAAMSAGFRESGISSILDSKGRSSNPIVAVRSSGLALDSIIGFCSDSKGKEESRSMVSELYLRTLLGVANERFRVNVERTMRFQEAFLEQVRKDPASSGSLGNSQHINKTLKPKRRQGNDHQNSSERRKEECTSSLDFLETADLDLSLMME